MKNVAALLMCAGVILSGCATFGTGSSQTPVDGVISMINSGDAGTLVEASALPFVYDGEIIMRVGDIETLWKNLSRNDFRIDDVRKIETAQISASSFRLFSPSKEMEFFFQRYVPDDAYTARLSRNSGDFILLLGEVDTGVLQILGMSGPKED